MQFVSTAESEAAAAARIGARLGARRRGELLGPLRPCLTLAGPWLPAGKYVSALVSGLTRRNGGTMAEHAGYRACSPPRSPGPHYPATSRTGRHGVAPSGPRPPVPPAHTADLGCHKRRAPHAQRPAASKRDCLRHGRRDIEHDFGYWSHGVGKGATSSVQIEMSSGAARAPACLRRARPVS